MSESSSDSQITRVFIVRRNLNVPGSVIARAVTHVTGSGYGAHSALLLKTKDGKDFLLEYMSDGNSHLYDVKYTVTKTYEKESYEDIIMNDKSWTKQLKGSEAPSGKTPNIAKKEMQEQMKGYSVSKDEVCHTAQERLRKLWKL